ncbi:MAG: hypothetical protein M5U14_22170 [Acidimicrobiia bacterium]|nr:hypothetical protein [Acidimicrobiia bacterium]
MTHTTTHRPAGSVAAARERVATARRFARWPIVLVATIALIAAGCGDDDDNESQDHDAACDAWNRAEWALGFEEDAETGVAALEDFVASAPADLAEAVEELVPMFREDLAAALESEELAEAEVAVDDFLLESCADTRVDVEAVNFAFNGIPAEIDAGRVVFNLTNRTQTAEFHEAFLLRLDDGDAHDVLAAALDPDAISAENTMEALGELTIVEGGLGFVEPPGGDEQDVFSADLEPGNYLLACLLPVGSDELIEPYFMGERIEGVERHFDDGMFASFTVK